MTTEFEQRQQAAIASGMVPTGVGAVDPVIGMRPGTGPLERVAGGTPGASETPYGYFAPTAAPVTNTQIVEEYMGLSVEEQERLAQALFTDGLMKGLGIAAIDDIYDPYNVAVGMQKALMQAETAFSLGTAREDEMLPTLEERFSGFTDEAFNEAAADLVEKYAVSYLDRATLNNLYTTAYRTEVGRTPSEAQLQSFAAGIHAAQDAGQTISLTNVSARAAETARDLNPERVQVMRENKAAQSIMRALEKL